MAASFPYVGVCLFSVQWFFAGKVCYVKPPLQIWGGGRVFITYTLWHLTFPGFKQKIVRKNRNLEVTEIINYN